jgi:tetratricopeptide (TPR) repeat protein
LSAKDVEVFVGRENEITQFNEFLKNKRNSAFIVIGEPGIGKSTFLKEIVRRLETESKGQTVVGFYDVPFYGNVATPFIGALEKLMDKLSLSLKTQVKDGAKRAKKVFFKILAEKGWKVAISMVKENAAKFIGKEGVEELENGFKEWKDTQGVYAVAENIISEYKETFVPNLMFFFNSLIEEFNELEFVLVLDQFERALLPACDVLLEFIRLKPKRVRIVVACKVEKGGMEKYSRIEPHLESMKIKPLEISPLSVEDIGEWTKKLGKEFTYHDLQKIRSFSGGIPFVIHEWLMSSEDFDLEELKGRAKDYCKFIQWRLERLEDKDCTNFVRKLSVLLQPLSVSEYEELSRNCKPLLDKLSDVWILSELNNTFWFRHELVKSCIEGMLGPNEKQEYNSLAARFFEKKYNDRVEANVRIDFDVALGCAYHFHHAKENKKSLKHNLQVANFCYTVGAMDIAEECYLNALEDAEILQDEDSKMVAKGNLGNVYRIWGRIDDAIEASTELLEYSIKKSDFQKEATALFNLAIIEYGKGNYAKASELCDRSLDIYKKHEDQGGISKNLHVMAIFEQRKGNYEKATALLNQSLEINKGLEDQRGISYALHQLATIYQSCDNYEEAIKLHNEAMKIDVSLGDQSSLSKTFHALAIIEQHRGNYERALDFYNQSLEIKKQLGDQLGISTSLHQLGIIEQLKGNYEKAIDFYNESLEIKKQLGDQLGISNSLHQLALIEENKGNHERALELFDQSLKIYKKLGNQVGLSKTFHNLGIIEQHRGNYERALDFYNQSLEVKKQLGDQRGIAITYFQLGVLYEKLKKHDESAEYFAKALAIFNLIGDKPNAELAKQGLNTTKVNRL